MSSADPRVETFRQVSFLSALDEETLAELASKAVSRRFPAGSSIVGELEPGLDLYVIQSGRAEVSLERPGGARRVLGALGPGQAFGEMASLTGELRSATVTALEDMDVFVVSDADFAALRERRPQVAIELVRVLAARFAHTERTIDRLLSAQTEGALVPEEAASTRRGPLSHAWQELVVGRKKDLAFLAFVGFAVTLVVLRLMVLVAFRFDAGQELLLRGAYLAGFALVVLSAFASLWRYRPRWRRVIALTYGVGMALVLNQLGLTLAFDIFYKDSHTPDPDHPFDLERLYRRTEAARALVLGLVVLAQAAYLRPFYRRVFFHLRMLLRRRPSQQNKL